MVKRQSAIMRLPRFQLGMLLVACLFFTICSSVASARAIDGFDLAVGEWHVTLRGGLNLDASNIFPQAEQARSLLPFKPRPPAPLPLKRRPWGKELDCTLVMSADGTFEIHPQSSSKSNSNSNSGRIPIRGKWNVFNSPYCATDRLYDQLTMQSYPRVQTQTTCKSEQQPQQYLQTGGMTFHCRMWGRYNTGGIFRQWRQYCGKLTHGTCVWREYDVSPEAKLPWWRVRRPVVASFSALRPRKQPLDQGGEDASLFGY
jgi:hypothetical protein